MIIPFHSIHGVRESQVDRSTALGCDGGRQDHSRSGGDTEFRGSHSSAVACLGTAVQRKRHGDSEEHRSQHWT